MHSPQHRSQSRPFLAAPRPAFYFPGRVVEAAREELERGIRRSEGAGLVVGQTGVGKSLLLAKLAEDLRDDFDVALLSGARICTRRALWQSVLAEIGEPYRGLEENDLRMNVVERVRGLAATCSGLVVLVDEAQTLPMRLVEELRLLSTVPTPLPAVHIVLAGTREIEERLASPKLESLAQRIVIRTYLEPFDHAETCRYVRSQCMQAGLSWEDHFEAGCEDALFSITDGVPRLINQVCDHALVAAGTSARRSPADIETAWREIQRLPIPESLNGSQQPADLAEPPVPAEEVSTISFGTLDDSFGDDWWCGTTPGQTDEGPEIRADRPHRIARVGKDASENAVGTSASTPTNVDPFQGPDVEFCFDSSSDPFNELFEDDGRATERGRGGSGGEFRNCQRVTSPEGGGLARDLAAAEKEVDEESTGGCSLMKSRREQLPSGGWPAERSEAGNGSTSLEHGDAHGPWEPAEERTWQDEYEYRSEQNRSSRFGDCTDSEADSEEEHAELFDGSDSPAGDSGDCLDADVIVVEEDVVSDPADADRSVFAVSPSDYRRLFARLRRR